jgi:hypothetical protein
MPGTSIRSAKVNSRKYPLHDQAAAFLGSLAEDAEGRKLLAEQNHRIEFDLTDGDPFYADVKNGSVTIRPGAIQPRRFDAEDTIHFQLQTATLNRLLQGKIRFTDALIPINPDGRDAMLLLECTLFKWSVLSWVGRMFRGAQLRSDRQPAAPGNRASTRVVVTGKKTSRRHDA